MSVYDAYRIAIDDSRVMFQIVTSLTDNSRGVINYCNMFIVQATIPAEEEIPLKQLKSRLSFLVVFIIEI